MLRTLYPTLPLRIIPNALTVMAKYGRQNLGVVLVVATIFMNVEQMLLAFLKIMQGEGGARTGQAYSQFSCWYSLFETREMPEVQLIEELTAGVSYRLELYLSLMDSLNYAVRNVGIHFSPTPHVANLDSILALTPQVSYEGQEFLTDKEGWMRISGSFVAQGGERYLAIGNFDDDAHTDTISVPNGRAFNPDLPDFWDVAAYFIDDVSVMADTATSIYELGEAQRGMELYPNPATQTLTVEIESGIQNELQLFDATGRLVLHQKLYSSKQEIGVRQLPRGVYIAVQIHKETVVGRKKVVLQ